MGSEFKVQGYELYPFHITGGNCIPFLLIRELAAKLELPQIVKSSLPQTLNREPLNLEPE